MFSPKTLLLALPILSLAQDVTVPATCVDGYEMGTSEALVTLPYTYDQVMSIIGSYKNLTWSGNPDDTVTLNGTDNTVGTARTYDTAGAHVIETILEYSKPPAPGPYNEVHNTANLSVPSVNVSFYIMYDGTVSSDMCDGMATMLNFTAHFCANNATEVSGLLTMLHTADGLGAGKLLGGQNFTDCAALAMMGGMPMPNATMSGMPPPANYTGMAARKDLAMGGLVAGVVGALWLL